MCANTPLWLLQKYRIYLRRLGGVSQHQGNMNHSFMTGQDPSFGPLSTLNGFDLQALAAAGQLPAQSLAQLQAAGLARPPSLSKPGMSVDQRSIFSFENPKIRHGQMMNSGGGGNKQMNLLHGVPMGMEPRQFAGGGQMRVQQQQQQLSGGRAVGQNVQSSGMMMPVGGGPSMLQQQQVMLSSSVPRRSETSSGSRVLPAAATTQSVVFNNFSSELPRNSFPLANAPGISVSYQEEVNSSDAKGGAGFGNPSYDIFNDYPQQYNNNNDWDLQNIGMVFNSHQDTTASAAFSTSSSTQRTRAEHVQNHHQQQQFPSQSLNHMNGGGSVRVKSERVAETVTCPPATTLFQEQYNQEDLMSALLKQVSFL